MRIAMLSPISRRTSPGCCGSRESLVSTLTEELVERGVDVTLFATLDSETRATLRGVCPRGYEEDPSIDPKVWECLHISEVFEHGNEFDLIHNHLDFLPLTYSAMTTTPVLTTVYGLSSSEILPVYTKYNSRCYYVAISEAGRIPALNYIATIHHGIDLKLFTFQPRHGDYLLFYGRIHRENGARKCIEIAKKSGKKLIIAGVIQDQKYFEEEIRPHIDGNLIEYIGSVESQKRNEVLGNAYALIHPIEFDETFNFSVIEAMACGTPVVAFKRGGMPELVRHGLTGFLCASFEEMLDAIEEVIKLDRILCRNWVEEHFNSGRMVEEYIKVYQKIIRDTSREDHRPWGFYEILSDRKDHKVKRITVYPGKRLSYQRHFRRAEHWYIVSGEATVTLDGGEYELKGGNTVDIPVGSWHRIKNTGTTNLVFIEVQRGDYFGEDDIERAEDDYGRV